MMIGSQKFYGTPEVDKGCRKVLPHCSNYIREREVQTKVVELKTSATDANEAPARVAKHCTGKDLKM